MTLIVVVDILYHIINDLLSYKRFHRDAHRLEIAYIIDQPQTCIILRSPVTELLIYAILPYTRRSFIHGTDSCRTHLSAKPVRLLKEEDITSLPCSLYSSGKPSCSASGYNHIIILLYLTGGNQNQSNKCCKYLFHILPF